MSSAIKITCLFLAITHLFVCNIHAQNWVETAREDIFHDLHSLKYGLKDKNGSFIIEPKYDVLRAKQDSTFDVRISGKYGIIDDKGMVIIPLEFSKVLIENNGCYIARNFKNKSGLINADGDTILPFEFDYLMSSFTDNPLLLFSKGSELKGVVNYQNEVVIPPSYDNIDIRSGFIKGKRDNKYYAFDADGEPLTTVGYEKVSSSGSNLVMVKKNGRVGLINSKTKKKVIDLEYDRINYLDSKYLSIEKNGNVGLYDFENNIFVLPLEYERISSRFANFFVLKDKGKYGLVSKSSGKVTVPCVYDKIKTYSEGSFYVKLDNKEGIVDTLNNTIIDLQEMIIKDFFLDAAIVKPKDKKTGMRANILRRDGLVFDDIQPTSVVLNHGSWKKNKPPYSEKKYTHDRDFEGVHFFTDGKIVMTVENTNGYAPDVSKNPNMYFLQ